MIDVRLTILSLPKELGASRNLQGAISPFNIKTAAVRLGMAAISASFPNP
jgi:hypothetical protein